MLSYNSCYGNAIFKLLFMTLLFGLLSHAHTQDAPVQSNNIAVDKSSSSILLSALVDTRFNLNNHKHKRNTNSTAEKAAHELIARASPPTPTPPSPAKVNETQVKVADPLQARDSASTLLANKDVKTAIEINNAAPIIGPDSAHLIPKAVKPDADKWENKQLTADKFFPGSFPDIAPRALIEPKEPQIDRILNKIESDMQSALHKALMELYSYVLKSVQKGDGTKTKHLIENDFLNLQVRALPTPSLPEPPSLGSIFASGELDLSKILKKLPAGDTDVLKLLQTLPTGETDLLKLIKTLPKGLYDDIMKNLNMLTPRQYENEQKRGDLLSLMNQPRNDYSGRALKDINTKPNAATKLVSTYLSDNDLTDLFKILSHSDSPMGFPADGNKYPLIMYLVNMKPDPIDYFKPTQPPFPTHSYPTFAPKPNMNYQPLTLAPRNFIRPENKVPPNQPLNIMCTHPSNCPSPELNHRLARPQPNLKSYPLNMQPKLIDETTIKDFYKILQKLESYRPNTAGDKLQLSDDSRNLLVKWLQDTIPFRGPEYDLIPHFGSDSEELQSRQLPALQNEDKTPGKENGCRCSSLPVKYISSLLNLLESKPVTKSEFIQYLVNIIQAAKSDTTTMPDAVFNESVHGGNCSCAN